MGAVVEGNMEFHIVILITVVRVIEICCSVTNVFSASVNVESV